MSAFSAKVLVRWLSGHLLKDGFIARLATHLEALGVALVYGFFSVAPDGYGIRRWRVDCARIVGPRLGISEARDRQPETRLSRL